MKPHIYLALGLCLLFLSVFTVAYAQDPAVAAADGFTLPTIPGVSVQTQLFITQAVIVCKLLAELYSSVKGGGGLKRIILSFWLGEQTPKVILQDYKKELSTPPFPPA